MISLDQEKEIALVWSKNRPLRLFYSCYIMSESVFIYRHDTFNEDPLLVKINAKGIFEKSKKFLPKDQKFLGVKIKQIIKILRPNSVDFILGD